MNSENPTALEICAGAGGQALGLVQGGFRLVDLVEADPYACATLTHNRKRLRLPLDMVITPRDLREYSLELPPNETLDLLAGGVPCPPFSVAGRQLGPEDERDLFPEVLRLSRELQPRSLMIENVKGLMSKRFSSYRAELEQELGALGLRIVFWEVVEASGFGVPQRRPRSVLVAFQEGLAATFSAPKPTARRVTVGQALRPHLSHWERVDQWVEGAQVIAPTLVGGSKRHGGADLGPTGAKAAWARIGVNGNLLADEPPTCDHVGPLTLTVEHAAVLQGFPAQWRFEGRKTARYRQVGNAFPPPVARAFAREIRRAITARA